MFPKLESRFAFKPHMNDVCVDAFNNQTINQNSNENTISKMKFYNPPNLIFQHLAVKEKIGNVEINRIRNGYFVDTLTSGDIQEIVKTKGKVIDLYEGVNHRENFKSSSFRKVTEK